MRNIPDVAMLSHFVWVTYGNGLSTGVEGDSCAGPLWAGFTALVNQQAVATTGTTVGFLNPTLYALGESSSYTALFHDTVTGNNSSTNSPTLFPAVTGYDLCTGWGTPMGTRLINALASQPFVPGPLGFAATTARIAQSGSGIQVSIQSLAGYGYQLQRASSLSSTANWQNIGSVQFGTGAVLNLVDSGSASLNSAFYRVQISQ